MPTRIQTRFRALKEQKRAALVAYVTAGDPSPDRTPAIVAALERGGADVIELGVPFSDPIADGPVIQAASERSLKAGTTLVKVLDIARRIREKSEIPLVLFTYLNPALRYGLEKLARDAKAAGIDGCLLTDLSVEEAEPYVKAMRGRHRRAHVAFRRRRAAASLHARRDGFAAGSGVRHLDPRTGFRSCENGGWRSCGKRVRAYDRKTGER